MGTNIIAEFFCIYREAGNVGAPYPQANTVRSSSQ